MLNVTKLLLAIGLSSLLISCSTIEGIGKDLKKGGQVIQDAANS